MKLFYETKEEVQNAWNKAWTKYINQSVADISTDMMLFAIYVNMFGIAGNRHSTYRYSSYRKLLRTDCGSDLKYVDGSEKEDSHWEDLIPATDTARPVTLTHDSGGHATVDWVGFMQAQDFGSVLYGNPQEREFPIQCVLTVTQGTDINYQQTAIQNFAYLLKQIVDAIPSAQRPTEFYIQGGSDAQAWLLKKIDWQNFVSEDADGNLTARYNCYDCLQDMCSFWGWTARTHGTKMYLTMADDSAETTWLYPLWQAAQQQVQPATPSRPPTSTLPTAATSSPARGMTNTCSGVTTRRW